MGSEYRLPLDRSNVGFLRAGLRTTDNEYGFSFMALGAGLEHAFSDFIVNLDYAYVPYGTIGPTQRITINLALESGEKKINAALTGPARFDLADPSVNLALKSYATDPVDKWVLDLTDEKGQLAREIKGTGEPPASYVWDGKNTDGVLVSAGTYGATLKVVDVDGLTANTEPVSFLAVAPLSLDNAHWTLSSDTTFNIASATIEEAEKDKLTIVGDGLMKYFGDVDVEIQGHTDNKPCRLGPHCRFNNNQELSEARAQSVKKLFIGLGIKPENIKTTGFGDTRPVADNTTDKGRAQNRRIEINIKSTRIETIESIFNAGIFLMNIGQPDQALQIFQLVVSHDPEKPDAYYYMANCYTKMGQLDKAQTAADQAAKLGGMAPPPMEP
jgi:outer membrane protein OmpA-like peptidoglycan-associated protein